MLNEIDEKKKKIDYVFQVAKLVSEPQPNKRIFEYPNSSDQPYWV